MAPTHEDRWFAVRLAAAVALFLLLVGQAHVTVLDGSSMLAVAQSIVHDGSLAVPQPLGVIGDSGLYYSKYGLLLPLLSVVPVALVQPLGAVTGRVDLLEAAAAAWSPTDPEWEKFVTGDATTYAGRFFQLYTEVTFKPNQAPVVYVEID